MNVVKSINSIDKYSQFYLIQTSKKLRIEENNNTASEKAMEKH